MNAPSAHEFRTTLSGLNRMASRLEKDAVTCVMEIANTASAVRSPRDIKANTLEQTSPIPAVIVRFEAWQLETQQLRRQRVAHRF
jgi:hypothetical protein